MRVKQSLIENVGTRKVKKVPFTYNVLAFLGKHFVFRSHKIKVINKVNLKELKGAYIVVGNHTSRMDYAYSAISLLPHRLTFISAYNEFFRAHLAPTLKSMQVIPKRSYYSDTHMIKEVSRVLSSGGRVIIFPEGESSMSGANQPVLPGTGKFLKHYGLPVVSVKIRGGYLTNPKFSMFSRTGRVEVETDILFTPDELKSLSGDEVQTKLDKALFHDDYEWNKTARVKFKMRGEGAKNLHHLLYWCPKCKKEYSMHGEGNVIKCTACSNGATLNEYYDLVPLDETCVIPENPRVWFDMQRQNVKEQIASPDFSYSESVSLGMLNPNKLIKDRKTSEPAGEGEITISHDGFSFKGIRRGEDFEFNVKPEHMMSLAYFTDMTFFATYYKDEMYEFTPQNARTLKFRLCVEEMHRLHGGKWNWQD